MDRNKYIPQTPHPRQRHLLLLNDTLEVMYGGAAGGGKSSAALMCAAQYVHVPGYAALLLRENFPDLNQPDALIPRSKEWWKNTDASYSERDRRWTFPCPGGGTSTITFGYLDSDDAVYQYQGAAFQLIGIDELTQHTLRRYSYLFSRVRRPVGGRLAEVPLRMRSWTNPGGRGHCVPYGSVLTPDGWRDIRDFKVGDPVYAVAPDGRLVASAVEQVHRARHTGDLIRTKARGLRMVCTPDHRVAKVGGARLATGRRFSLTPFESLPGQATVLRSVAWEGRRVAVFRPEPYPTRRRRLTQPREISGDHYAELMGWFLSEGSTVDRDKAFDIAQMKPAGRAKIEALLTACGFQYIRLTDKSYRVHAPDWWAYLRQFGRCREKHIPSALRDAPPDQLRLLFNALMAGDGHWIGPESGQYYTLSERLAQDVAEVAVKLGFVVSVLTRRRANRVGPCYAVNFKRTKSGGTELLTGNHVYAVETSTKRRSEVTREPYDGEVYCIGVPDHHAFVIMQDGCVWVSGNSWVYNRFVDPRTRRPGAVFVPAKLQDNPSLDAVEYAKSLTHVDPITRAQLLAGDWNAVAGGRFKAGWFRDRWRRDGDHVVMQRAGESAVRHYHLWGLPRFITCDPAASAKTTADYTVALCWAQTPLKELLLVGGIRVQLEIPDIVPALEAFWELMRRPGTVGVEAVAANAAVYQAAKRTRMPVKQLSPAGQDKLVRATPAMNLAESGRIWLPAPGAVPGLPLDDIESELFRFTGDDKVDDHDDVVDNFSYGVYLLQHGNAAGTMAPHILGGQR